MATKAELKRLFGFSVLSLFDKSDIVFTRSESELKECVMRVFELA